MLRRELILDGDNIYRIHSINHGGRLATVNIFEGYRAKQVSTFLCLFYAKAMI